VSEEPATLYNIITDFKDEKLCTESVLDMVSGLCVRRNMFRNSKIVVGATLWEGG
jgi:hypothetical protein